MSEEQVEIVREHIEAVRSRDFPRALSLFDPHVVVDMARIGGPEEDAAFGPEGVADYMRRYAGTFEDYRYEVERLTDLGSGAVLAAVTETGRGKGSGVPVNRSFATLYTVIDGKIARCTLFHTEQEALEAAGLRE
jgi:ketosteroid isomerase-like protein